MNLTKKDIIQEIREDILSLKLKPGTILSEATLTKKYNLSRTPIRDILKQLSRDGYIDIYPQRGSKVSFINLKSVEQVIFLRATLEKEIIKELCGKISQPMLNKLNTILDKQKNAITTTDYFTNFMTLDDQFHKQLFIIADRLFLWELIQTLNVHYVRYRTLHMLKKDKLITLYNEHKTITELLTNGMIENLDTIINKHISGDVNSDYFKKNFLDYILPPE